MGAFVLKLLEDRIRKEGQVRAGNVLKVDCFLNHQLDVRLLDAIGAEFYRQFKDDERRLCGVFCPAPALVYRF